MIQKSASGFNKNWGPRRKTKKRCIIFGRSLRAWYRVLNPTPVPLYEFELRELFVEATVKSGCKWWCRKSQPSRASKRLTAYLWATSFVCRHSGNDYKKQTKDNSRTSRHILQCGCRASCKMKAISVRMNTTECLLPFPLFMLL